MTEYRKKAKSGKKPTPVAWIEIDFNPDEIDISGFFRIGKNGEKILDAEAMQEEIKRTLEEDRKTTEKKLEEYFKIAKLFPRHLGYK